MWTAIIAGGIVFFVWLLCEVFLMNRATGRDPLEIIGAEGEALETFVEDGRVTVLGEVWRAESLKGIIEKGAKVRVVAKVAGLKLQVTKTKNDQKG